LAVKLDSTGDALVTVSMTNSCPRTATVLSWNTPLDDHSKGFRSDMFYVIHSSGESATYVGMLMKRRPVITDLATLQPGQTITTTLDLSQGYSFPLAGEYTVYLKTATRMAHGDLDFQSVPEALATLFNQTVLESNTITIQVAEPSKPIEWGSPPVVGGVSHVSCTAQQTTRVNGGDTNANSMLNTALGNIKKGCTSSYILWMGACPSTSRQNTVQTTFSNIQNRRNAGYKADCSQKGCPANTYAYVYSTDTSYTVYLCSLFFSSSSQSSCTYDCTGGVMIHEISHFSNVGGTKDNAYGVTNCQNLAKSNPDSAVKNADNYEYMSEYCQA